MEKHKLFLQLFTEGDGGGTDGGNGDGSGTDGGNNEPMSFDDFLNEEEKAEYRAKKAEKELEELQRMNARTELAKTARKMLADDNINISDELLSNLVADDADGTKTAVESFAKMYKEAVQAAVK